MNIDAQRATHELLQPAARRERRRRLEPLVLVAPARGGGGRRLALRQWPLHGRMGRCLNLTLSCLVLFGLSGQSCHVTSPNRLLNFERSSSADLLASLVNSHRNPSLSRLLAVATASIFLPFFLPHLALSPNRLFSILFPTFPLCVPSFDVVYRLWSRHPAVLLATPSLPLSRHCYLFALEHTRSLCHGHEHTLSTCPHLAVYIQFDIALLSTKAGGKTETGKKKKN